MQTCGQQLETVAGIVRRNRDTAEHLSLTLSPSQLEWRPTVYGRGVAEWIEYLGKSGDLALAAIHAAMLPAWRDPSFEDQPYQRSMAGRFALARDRLRGDGRNAVQHEPRRSASRAMFAQFLVQQSDLLSLIDEAHDVDLHSAPAGWVIGRVFGLCVGDALELMALRQRRGLDCVVRVTEMPGFPKRVTAPVPRAGGMLRLA